MLFERYKESYPSLILVQNYCRHAYSFIENIENVYEDDDFIDNEIMEALYENPFLQHKESDTYQDDQENLQVQDLKTIENYEREGLTFNLLIVEDSMQGNQVSILDCDKVKLTNSDLDSDHDDKEDLDHDDEEIVETSHFVTKYHNQHIVASSLLEDEGILHLDSQQESYKMNQQYEENLYTPLFEINGDNHC